MMPPAPTAHFIIPHPQILFAVLETGLDRPAHPAQPHQRRQRGVAGALHRYVFNSPVMRVASQDQPDLGAGQALPHRHHPHPGKCGPPRPLAPFLESSAANQRLRRQRAGQLGDRIGAGSPPSTRARVGLRPRPDQAGTAVAGRVCQTWVSWGTSAKYHSPSPAI